MNDKINYDEEIRRVSKEIGKLIEQEIPGVQTDILCQSMIFLAFGILTYGEFDITVLQRLVAIMNLQTYSLQIGNASISEVKAARDLQDILPEGSA